jgi:hypothetical protein
MRQQLMSSDPVGKLPHLNGLEKLTGLLSGDSRGANVDAVVRTGPVNGRTVLQAERYHWGTLFPILALIP